MHVIGLKPGVILKKITYQILIFIGINILFSLISYFLAKSLSGVFSIISIILIFLLSLYVGRKHYHPAYLGLIGCSLAGFLFAFFSELFVVIMDFIMYAVVQNQVYNQLMAYISVELTKYFTGTYYLMILESIRSGLYAQLLGLYPFYNTIPILLAYSGIGAGMSLLGALSVAKGTLQLIISLD